MDEFFTVDQFAQVLDMHPRTVRRYIREGQLKATKVGGEWRIRKDDANVFLGGSANVLHDHAVDDIGSYLDGFSRGPVTGKYQVCAVLDCSLEDDEEAYEVSKLVMKHMNTDPNHGQAKSQYFYDQDANKGRYILWGNPDFIGRILTSVGEFAHHS